jgi:hypothetical protein
MIKDPLVRSTVVRSARYHVGTMFLPNHCPQGCTGAGQIVRSTNRAKCVWHLLLGRKLPLEWR